MSKFSLALFAASSLVLATPALADSASIPSSVMDWSGPTVGAEYASGWGRENDNFTEVTGYPGTFGSLESSDHYHLTGNLAGLNAGFNQQYGVWVVGVAADIALGDISGKSQATFNTGEGTGFSSLSLRNTWQSTFRVRGGYAFEKALIYAEGGVAIGDARLSYTVDDPTTFDSTLSGSQTKTLVGWTAGAGVQYALTSHWSIGAEGRYLDLGKASYNIPAELSLSGTQTSYKAGFTESEALFLLQYRF